MPTKVQRLNVTITEEQRALLFELAELEGGSASGWVRQMIDRATPLLRVSVPMLRQAAQEKELALEEASALLKPVVEQMSAMGLLDQLDLIDDTELSGATTVRNAASAQASEAERRRAAQSGSDNGDT